jgi:thiol-disulfide isomerase/thioredoxin
VSTIVRGEPAPALDVPLLGGGFRGLADLVEPGGGVLLFFKSTCETCRLVLPRLNPLARALAREERLFLAVAQEDEEGARAFRDERGLDYLVAWERAPYAASTVYGITTVPTLLIVDGAGIVAERLEGFVKREYLALGVAAEQALALGDAPAVLERPEDLPDLKPG